MEPVRLVQHVFGTVIALIGGGLMIQEVAQRTAPGLYAEGREYWAALAAIFGTAAAVVLLLVAVWLV